MYIHMTYYTCIYVHMYEYVIYIIYMWPFPVCFAAIILYEDRYTTLAKDWTTMHSMPWHGISCHALARHDMECHAVACCAMP